MQTWAQAQSEDLENPWREPYSTSENFHTILELLAGCSPLEASYTLFPIHSLIFPVHVQDSKHHFVHDKYSQEIYQSLL